MNEHEIRNRHFIEEHEKSYLAPYAVKASQSKGRAYPEKEHGTRSAFQRDRDRIVHSTAFRRLEYKTQVFVNHEGDHYRTRLTHSLEVSQIARTISRSLGLNEDLTEAISLAHDLGHGPFGHAGEWALTRKMKDHGGFEHNRQSLRIVEEIEHSYADFHGLNLTYEVREGLKKHEYERKEGRSVRSGFYSLEAQIVNIADEIAYDSHDVDDGLRSKLLTYEDVKELTLIKEIESYIKKMYKRIDSSSRNYLAIRLLINHQVSDLIENTFRRIKKFKIKTPYDVIGLHETVVCFSHKMHKKKEELRKFLKERLYYHPYVVRMAEKAQRYVEELFDAYIHNPKQLEFWVQENIKRHGKYRAICDYLAGMTDRFAIGEYRRIFSPMDIKW